ncbi:hypothetical protein V8C86DRAFT_2850609 [Haematococcus lacustris]
MRAQRQEGGTFYAGILWSAWLSWPCLGIIAAFLTKHNDVSHRCTGHMHSWARCAPLGAMHAMRMSALLVLHPHASCAIMWCVDGWCVSGAVGASAAVGSAALST